MSRPLTIAIDAAAGESARSVVRSTVATLPESFRLVEEPGDVVAVDGAGDWPERTLAVIDAGAAGVVVVRPRSVRPEQLQTLSETRTPVVLDAPWRHNSTVQRISPYFRSVDASGSMLEARTTVPSTAELRDAVTALAFTGQSLIGASIADLRVVVRTPDHLIVLGTAPDLLIRLSAIVGPAPACGAWFRLLGGNEIATVTVPSSESGATGVGAFVEAGVKTTVESAFESTHRSALALVRRTLEQGSALTDLADFTRITVATSDLASVAS